MTDTERERADAALDVARRALASAQESDADLGLVIEEVERLRGQLTGAVDNYRGAMEDAIRNAERWRELATGNDRVKADEEVAALRATLAALGAVET